MSTTLASEFSASLPLGPVVSGDSWLGRSFQVQVRDAVTREWVSPDGILSPLAAVVMQIHTADDDLDALAEFTSAGGDITIDDAGDWQFTVGKVEIDLPAGDYFYGIRCEDDDGDFLTPFKGTFRVTGKGVLVTP